MEGLVFCSFFFYLAFKFFFVFLLINFLFKHVNHFLFFIINIIFFYKLAKLLNNKVLPIKISQN